MYLVERSIVSTSAVLLAVGPIEYIGADASETRVRGSTGITWSSAREAYMFVVIRVSV
jgi:hypothetical protein